MPSHGHINPTLGLVSELTDRGELVYYFASEEFRDKVEAAGGILKCYNEDLNIFKPQGGALFGIVGKAPGIIANILGQIEGIKFDYLVHSAAFLFAKPLTQILGIPAISSLAVFAGLRDFNGARMKGAFNSGPAMEQYAAAAKQIEETYQVTMPEDILGLLLDNKAGLNLVYTSEYFVPDREFFDDSYVFVGPPVYGRHENLDFPFELLDGIRVLYISLGTVFGGFDTSLYQKFFEAFGDWDGMVVMAAHKVDFGDTAIPANFIIRDYVPQNALLKRTTAAITHGGMNSMSDLISNHVPFVCIPLGADQPQLSARAGELGAAISLDAKTLTADGLRLAIEKVIAGPGYLANILKIDQSFRAAGGYPKAVDHIFEFVGKKQ